MPKDINPKTVKTNIESLINKFKDNPKELRNLKIRLNDYKRNISKKTAA